MRQLPPFCLTIFRPVLVPLSLWPFRTGIPGARQLLLLIYIATAGGFPGIPIQNGRRERGVGLANAGLNLTDSPE